MFVRLSGFKNSGLNNWLVSAIITLVIVLAFFLNKSEWLFHWCSIPIFLFGLLVVKDISDWFFGRIDFFHPVMVVALFQFREFAGMVARPVVDGWLRNVESPPDWRPWAGVTAIAYGIGYLILKSTSSFVRSRVMHRSKKIRLLDHNKFQLLFFIFLFLGVMATAFTFRQGVVDHITERATFEGMGIVLAFSESLPIVVFMAVVLKIKNNRMPVSFFLIIVLLGSYFIALFVLGGLRGSRSNVLFNMFWAVAIIHLYLKPITKKEIMVLLAGAVVFIYSYSFYKKFGTEGFLAALSSSEERSSLAQSKRGEGAWYQRIIGGGTVVYTAYRILDKDSDYRLAYGGTYFAAIQRFVPRFIINERSLGKNKYGTQVLYGQRAWLWRQTSLVWGCIGEAMLNFGVIASPLAMIVPGVFLGFVSRQYENRTPGDLRNLLLPFLCLCCVSLISSDSELLAFFFVKNGLLPFCLVYLGSFGVRTP